MKALGRFFDKTEIQSSGCVLWTAGRTRDGYGAFQAQTRLSALAHRWLWEELNGPIAAGLELDHLCRNRACVNLAHLDPVTHRENVLRGEGVPAINARKTRCKRGHALTLHKSGTFRRCLPCDRAAKARYAERIAGERIVLSVTAYVGDHGEPVVIVDDRRAA